MTFLSNTQFPTSENPPLSKDFRVVGFVGSLFAIKTCAAALVFGVMDIVIPLIAGKIAITAVTGLLIPFGAFLAISVVILAISGLLIYYSKSETNYRSIDRSIKAPMTYGQYLANEHDRQMNNTYMTYDQYMSYHQQG